MYTAAHAIAKTLESRVLDGHSEDITIRLEAHLAIVIAQHLELPKTDIGLVPSWSGDHAMFVRKFVCEINELFVLDTERLIGLIKRAYQTRYNLVYDAESAIGDLGMIIEKVLGEKFEVPGVTLELDRSLFNTLGVATRSAINEYED